MFADFLQIAVLLLKQLDTLIHLVIPAEQFPENKEENYSSNNNKDYDKNFLIHKTTPFDKHKVKAGKGKQNKKWASPAQAKVKPHQRLNPKD